MENSSPKREEQQDHADGGTRLKEIGGGGNRCDTAVAERQSGEQIERDRRQCESSRSGAQHRENDEDRAELK